MQGKSTCHKLIYNFEYNLKNCACDLKILFRSCDIWKQYLHPCKNQLFFYFSKHHQKYQEIFKMQTQVFELYQAQKSGTFGFIFFTLFFFSQNSWFFPVFINNSTKNLWCHANFSLYHQIPTVEIIIANTFKITYSRSLIIFLVNAYPAGINIDKIHNKITRARVWNMFNVENKDAWTTSFKSKTFFYYNVYIAYSVYIDLSNHVYRRISQNDKQNYFTAIPWVRFRNSCKGIHLVYIQPSYIGE